MNRAIKYRIYPTKLQEELLQKTFGCCRKIWNLMLADKINYYKETKQALQTTPAQYKEEYDYLKEVDSLALANVQLHLQTAYKNFFRDKKIGFPKFKALKISKKSYTTNNQKGTIQIIDDTIKLPKVGKIKAKIHKKPKEDSIIKSATLSQERDGTYYISVLFEYDEVIEKVEITKTLGLDYKSDGFYTDSEGNFKNGKATLDNGYGMFLNMLEYKLQDRGKYFVKVDRWYASSQICSKCGNKKKIKLNERTYTCDCGNTIDRDLNAAINIKNEGLRLLKTA